MVTTNPGAALSLSREVFPASVTSDRSIPRIVNGFLFKRTKLERVHRYPLITSLLLICPGIFLPEKEEKEVEKQLVS